ncbi:MAG: hypothetical protein J6N56_04805 [Bacteroidales bacterium]|nr:hypothetical protein [Bacteroidales bacterium]
MDKNKLTEFLKRLKSALHKRRLDRKLLNDLQFEWFTIDKEKIDLSEAYGMLSTINEGLDEERSKELEWLYLRLMSGSISSKNNTTCPYYLQKENSDIKLPFKTWDEELSAVDSYGSNRINDIEIDCFRRCCRCREIDCPYRIIRSDKECPYWRQSEYEQRNPNTQEQIPATEYPPQTVAPVRADTYRRSINSILTPLCRELANESLAEIDVASGEYTFTGTGVQYAYLARLVTNKSRPNGEEDHIPWRVITKKLKPPRSQKNLKSAASRIGRNRVIGYLSYTNGD